jgi:catechol 2,3-dioxygenase-like lactoylglutathione lyase family enzyme
MMSSWTSVTVGVADLDHALDFWVNSFGFEVQGRKEGQDLDLARLWDIQPGDIARQALLKTPGETTGMMQSMSYCWNWLAMNCHSASRASLVLGL